LKFFGRQGHADVLCGAKRCAEQLGTFEPPFFRVASGYTPQATADGDLVYLRTRVRVPLNGIADEIAALEMPHLLTDPQRPPVVLCGRCGRLSYVRPSTAPHEDARM
jgi:hypothetical protein